MRGSRTQATTPLPPSLRSRDQTTRVCLVCVVSAGLSQGHGPRQAALGEEPSPFLSRESRAAGLVTAPRSLRWSLCPARPGSVLGAGDGPRRRSLLFHSVTTCDSGEGPLAATRSMIQSGAPGPGRWSIIHFPLGERRYSGSFSTPWNFPASSVAFVRC